MKPHKEKDPGSFVPLPRMIEFLRTVSPFEALGPEELSRLVSCMEIAFFPQGQRIVKKGDEIYTHLYIIQKGSARISLIDDSGNDLLVDVRGEGDYFGASSILESKPAMFNISAQQDLLTLMLPAEQLQRLAGKYPVFKRYFSLSLARTIKAVRQSNTIQWPQPIGQDGVNLDVLFFDKRVADLMIKDVLTCAPDVSARHAAQLMEQRRVSSIVVIGNDSRPLGIVTDNDLSSKVLAAGISPDTVVAEIMNQPLCTIAPGEYAIDALLSMSKHGVRLLVVTEEDRLVGVISEHDLQMATGNSPVQVLHEIQRSSSLDHLIGLRPQIDRVLEMLLRQGGPIKQLVALITELNDRLTLRILKLAEQKMDQDGFGGPPVPYSWIAFGSEGRREQTLHTDQDNGLFFSTVPSRDEAECKTWFLKFAELVVDSLVRSGIPPCPGGFMASNPQWCQTEDWWQAKFLEWIKEPNPETLLMASIFFDFRPIHAGTEFPNILQDRLFKAVRKKTLFLRYMAKVALINRPPLGLLKRFVVEKTGEHKNQLDLKMRGLTPVVDAARALSLQLSINTQNTSDRLTEIKRKGVIDAGFHADLREAYEYIIYLQINRHLDAIAEGKEPDNFLDPESLNNLQRKMLKESFLVISRLQETIEFRFNTRLLEI